MPLRWPGCPSQEEALLGIQVWGLPGSRGSELGLSPEVSDWPGVGSVGGRWRAASACGRNFSPVAAATGALAAKPCSHEASQPGKGSPKLPSQARWLALLARRLPRPLFFLRCSTRISPREKGPTRRETGELWAYSQTGVVSSTTQDTSIAKHRNAVTPTGRIAARLAASSCRTQGRRKRGSPESIGESASGRVLTGGAGPVCRIMVRRAKFLPPRLLLHPHSRCGGLGDGQPAVSSVRLNGGGENDTTQSK